MTDFGLESIFQYNTYTTSDSGCRSHTTDVALISVGYGNAVRGDVLGGYFAHRFEEGDDMSLVAVKPFDLWLAVRSDGRPGYGHFLGSRGYLGLVFDIPTSGAHSAWAEVEVIDFSRIMLYGFAYESEHGQPILAGDIGTLPPMPGDTNGDGQVDITDLNNVRNNFGGEGLGDTNDNGMVDIEDLNAVRNNFGAGDANAVPEPPSLVLLAAGAAGLGVLRRKRRLKKAESAPSGG